MSGRRRDDNPSVSCADSSLYTREPKTRGAGEMEIRPITLKQANAFVQQHHRHNGPVAGQRFSLSLSPMTVRQLE